MSLIGPDFTLWLSGMSYILGPAEKVGGKGTENVPSWPVAAAGYAAE